jgi:hypothetical protein
LASASASASRAAGLLAGDLPAAAEPAAGDEPAGPADGPGAGPCPGEPHAAGEAEVTRAGAGHEPPAVYGDAAYGTGELLDALEQAGADIYCKVQPPVAPGGRFTKDAFSIDLAAGTVTCPAGLAAPLRPFGDGRVARFGAACAACPLAAQCTTAKDGRSIYAGPYEEQLSRARARQASPDWKTGYRATRPKVERKIGHLMRRRHGGRRARVRGQVKVAADFALLAASVNLARLAVLGLASHGGTWVASTG